MGKLTRCPDCGATVSKQAHGCPSCGRPFKAAKKTGCLTGCLAIVFAVVGIPALIIAITSNSPNKRLQDLESPSRPTTPVVAGMMPEVAKFLQEHPEFGRARNAKDLIEWAQGKRQRIDFGLGRSLEFYEKDGVITSVWDRSPGAAGAIIWGKSYEPAPFVPVDRAATADLPAYKVLYIGGPMRGGKPVGDRSGDVLIPSLSPSTPADERESIARKISEAEGIGELSVYSTEEARKANMSASYSEEHPYAMKNGFLGSIRNGKFTPGETP